VTLEIETLAIVLALLVAGCPAPSEPEPMEGDPDPIGDELLRFDGTWAASDCARSHLYREGRSVQQQCFDADDAFSWENRGTLTVEAAAALDAAIASADLDDTDPINYMGLCGAPDAYGTVTLWAGERSVSFEPFCLTMGIVELYEQVTAINTELWNCAEPFTMLESVEPGCRWE
jgi:hypothetical protein